MALLPVIDRLRARLMALSEVAINQDYRHAPAPPTDIAALEVAVGIGLPRSLRQVLEQEAGGVRFAWRSDCNPFGSDCPFGPECRFGDLHILQPAQLAAETAAIREYAAGLQRAGAPLADHERAVVRDWPHWIPLCRFQTGDAFCLDARAEGGNHPIVFLDHEAVGDASELHGLRIAPHFDALLDRWAAVAFIENIDWSRCVDRSGINPHAPIFRQLRARLAS